MDYLFHILILTGIFTILAISLDLLIGHLGILSITHAGFFGIGAYVSALCSVEIGTSFLSGIAVGMLFGCLVSLVVSIPSLRLHDDYFVIGTFGFQMILFNVFNNWIAVTRGPMGIPGIPQPTILGWNVTSGSAFLVLTTVFAVLTYFVSVLITSSPFGRVLHALRENEVFAQAQGKNALRFKVTAIAVSSSLAAMAGGLYAHYITYIAPASFSVMESILMIAMVIIGGAGSRGGPFLGAFLLVILPEGLRFVGLPEAVAANVRQMIYGGLLIVMMAFRPGGLVGRYQFAKE